MQENQKTIVVCLLVFLQNDRLALFNLWLPKVQKQKKKEVKKVAIFGITANDDEHCMKW